MELIQIGFKNWEKAKNTGLKSSPEFGPKSGSKRKGFHCETTYFSALFLIANRGSDFWTACISHFSMLAPAEVHLFCCYLRIVSSDESIQDVHGATWMCLFSVWNVALQRQHLKACT